MYDIVCIKIGQNEPASYEKINQLSKHLDIIEILPRKRDERGNLINRGLGIKAEKKYLALAVDMSHLNDELFEQFRNFVKQTYLDLDIPDSNNGDNYTILAKRKFKIDLNRQTKLDNLARTKLNDFASKRTSKQSFDAREISDTENPMQFIDFISMVVSKKDSLSMDKFLPDKYKSEKFAVEKVRA